MLLRALVAGLVAGAAFLGGGTRLAMRGVASIEGRIPVLTLTGTLEVVMFGALFGLAFALLWAVLGRRIPGNRLVRGLLFGALTAVLASPGLTPRRVSTFLLFVPWFLAYGVTMSLLAASRRREVRSAHSPWAFRGFRR